MEEGLDNEMAHRKKLKPVNYTEIYSSYKTNPIKTGGDIVVQFWISTGDQQPLLIYSLLG